MKVQDTTIIENWENQVAIGGTREDVAAAVGLKPTSLNTRVSAIRKALALKGAKLSSFPRKQRTKTEINPDELVATLEKVRGELQPNQGGE